MAVDVSMAGNSDFDPAPWIADAKKYALIGLNVKVEGRITRGALPPHFFVLADTKFDIPAHWRDWLGSIRANEVERCDLLLISKLHSSNPDILDDENQTLQQRVANFYVGLMLANRFASAHRPVMLSGSRRDGEVGIRQQHDFDSPVPCFF
jgi:hypothetical protein